MSETTELIAQQILNGNINKRTWGDILYNVKVYGAVGDGVKDDTAAIQAAIDYAVSVGGKAIFFPHGTYKVTALTKLSSVVLFGDNASFVGVTDTINQIGKPPTPPTSLVYNVKDYGAKGDGATEDTIAIQAAINAASTAGGGIVFFPPGTYTISTTLTLKNGVSLVGTHSTSAFLEINPLQVTALKWTGASGGTMIVTDLNWTGKMSGLVLDGNWLADRLLSLLSSNGSTFEDLSLIHAKTSTSQALYMYTSGNFTNVLNTFIRVNIHDTGYIGLDLTGLTTSPVTLNTFIGCRFAANYISVRLSQWCDTNYFYGGRIECPTNGFGLVIDVAGGNGIDSCTFNAVVFDGVASSSTGVLAKQSSSNPNFLTNCHFGGLFTALISLGAGALLKCVDCPGLGSTGKMYDTIAAIAIGASPFTYTNNDYHAEEISVSGGAVSDIQLVRNGMNYSMGMTSGVFSLEIGDGIIVSYTTLPNMKKIPH